MTPTIRLGSFCFLEILLKGFTIMKFIKFVAMGIALVALLGWIMYAGFIGS